MRKLIFIFLFVNYFNVYGQELLYFNDYQEGKKGGIAVGLIINSKDDSFFSINNVIKGYIHYKGDLLTAGKTINPITSYIHYNKEQTKKILKAFDKFLEWDKLAKEKKIKLNKSIPIKTNSIYVKLNIGSESTSSLFDNSYNAEENIDISYGEESIFTFNTDNTSSHNLVYHYTDKKNDYISAGEIKFTLEQVKKIDEFLHKKFNIDDIFQ